MCIPTRILTGEIEAQKYNERMIIIARAAKRLERDLSQADYGIYAFFRRQLGEYLFLRSHFVFFDDSEPLIFFFIDYLAIMGLFVFVGHYLAGWLKRLDEKGSHK
jgi:membrane protein